MHGGPLGMMKQTSHEAEGVNSSVGCKPRSQNVSPESGPQAGCGLWSDRLSGSVRRWQLDHKAESEASSASIRTERNQLKKEIKGQISHDRQ